MNWIDGLLAGILLLFLYAGIRRGFVSGILDLLTWAASLAGAYFGYPYLASLATWFNFRGPWLFPVSFLSILVIAVVILGLLLKPLRGMLAARLQQSRLNQLLGIIPGSVNGLVIASLIASLLLVVPTRPAIKDAAHQSRLAAVLTKQTRRVNQRFAPIFDEAARKTWKQIAGTPAEHGSLRLNFTCDDAQPVPNLESKMLELINRERTARGLQPLVADPPARQLARAHSRDMFNRGYFAHENPEGQDPFDRMKEARIHFSSAGENLALAQTLDLAHHNLMNSPGHRANILNPSFHRVGIGILDGGFYGLMISQEFRN